MNEASLKHIRCLFGPTMAFFFALSRNWIEVFRAAYVREAPAFLLRDLRFEWNSRHDLRKDTTRKSQLYATNIDDSQE